MDFNKNNRLQKQSEITLKDRFCKCIEVISKNTMGIYLVHVLVLRTIEKFSIQASFTSNITVGIIYSIVVTLISLIITLLELVLSAERLLLYVWMGAMRLEVLFLE